MTSSYPFYTPYQFAGNTPIRAIDIDGLEPDWLVNGTEWVGNKAMEYVVEPTIDFGKNALNYASTVGTASYNAVAVYIPHTFGFEGAEPADLHTTEGTFEWGSYQADKVVKESSANLATDVVVGEITGGAGKYILKPVITKVVAKTVVSKVVKAIGWENRLAAFNKFSPNWAKGSKSSILEKYAKDIEGKISKDGVKTRYHNTNTGIEVIVDNENDYFRIFDHNKNQYLDLDGKVPSTGKLSGEAAKDQVQSQTHIVNTD